MTSKSFVHKERQEVYLLEKVVAAITGVIIGFVLHLVWKKIADTKAGNSINITIENARREAEKIVRQAEVEARNEILQEKEALEQEIALARTELRELEKRLNCKEENLNYRFRQLEKREEELQRLQKNLELEEKRLQEERSELERTLHTELKTLQRIAGFSQEQATEMLLNKLEDDVEEEAAQLIQKTMSKAKLEAYEKAREILLTAVQRCAVEYTATSVTATIDLPNDHMKGRIIGKEGRNIRTFEKVSGVDVIVDETPAIVVVSSFDPVRREIARRAMEKLVQDGRIHPARIEEVLEDTKKEMEQILTETGKQAACELDIQEIHPREIQLLGKLKFQMMMGQNMLGHTMEIAYVVSLLASEFHMDTSLAKRCALLHDIGRSVDHTYEGSHAAIGADIAKKCQERPEVVNAIASHHEEVPATSLYAVLLQIAHKIVMERPGAVKEYWERHLKRLERLENIALSFKGVENAYIIQAGCEIRCIVNASQISDSKAITLSRNIARKLKQESVSTGEIKVVVVRETRIIEYAK